MMTREAAPIVAVEGLEPRRLLSVSLVKDINTHQQAVSGLWGGLTAAGNIAYLSVTDGVHGTELWRSDGTTAGTYLVKDINPGPAGSTGTPVTTDFTAVGNELFFVADDGVHGAELWKSDGTAAGTQLVKDIVQGTGSSNPGQLVNVNGTLFFEANDGVSGAELWKSDGTAAGTMLVKDINPGPGDGISTLTSLNPPMVNDNGTLVFVATETTHGTELWRSDGTSAGTVMIKDINPGTAGSSPAMLTVCNAKVYFAADTAAQGTELWRSDGTATGTVIVRDLVSGPADSDPKILATSGKYFYYTPTFSGPGYGVVRSDGTAAGELIIDSAMSSPADVNGTLYYVNNNSLYKTDGTTVTAVRTKFTSIRYLTNVNGTLYFAGDDGSGAGQELWKSDGTAAGTVMVKDLSPGASASQPQLLVPVGNTGRVLFAASDPVAGIAFYSSDGTAGGTQFVMDIDPQTDFSYPAQLKAFNGALYFQATDGTNGTELWRTDGTEAGTVMFKDINPGSAASAPTNLTVFNGRLYFSANDGVHGGELWQSDGTAAGTSMMVDIAPGATSSGPGGGSNGFVASGSYLYFDASDGTTGTELWRTDGTAAGTIRLADIVPGSYGSTPSSPTDVNGTLYFTAPAATGSSDKRLWKTDGTPAGTVQVNTTATSVASLAAVGDTLYFTASAGLNYGYVLWKSDGTAAGIVPIPLGSGYSSNAPTMLTNVGGTLFFVFSNQLWKSDGTVTGTTLVKAINPNGSSDVSRLTAVNGVLYFTADDGTHDVQLWRSDGTASGTYMVADVSNPGGDGVRNLAAVNGYLYFTVDDGTFDGDHGIEPWRSDGTAAGTVLLGDVYPGPTDAVISANLFTAFGNDVYFNDYDGYHGDELFRADPPSFATLGGDGTLTVSGTANNDVVHLASDGASIQVNMNGLVTTFAAGSITSIVVNGTAGQDEVDVDSSLTTPLQFAGASSYTLDVNASTLTLGGNALPAGSNVAVGAGAAVVFAGSESLGNLTIADGAASIPSGLGATLTVAGLFSITGSGTLDVGDNALLVPSTPDVAAYVARAAGAAQPSGLNAWTGSGLTSGLVKSDAANGNAKQLTLGYFDSRDNGQTGLSVPAGQTLVKLTVYGDATGDGKVSIADLSVWNNNFGVSAARWSQGDFNYDGKVNIADLSVWNNDFGNSVPATGAAAPAVLTAGTQAATVSAAVGSATPTVGAPVTPSAPAVAAAGEPQAVAASQTQPVAPPAAATSIRRRRHHRASPRRRRVYDA